MPETKAKRRRTRNTVTPAAEALGMSRPTFYRQLAEYGEGIIVTRLRNLAASLNADAERLRQLAKDTRIGPEDSQWLREIARGYYEDRAAKLRLLARDIEAEGVNAA